ncbi:hypothetical protein J4558_17645 [Leptolyngbya sp. 15MV]|nr:hypothetical protein J4558_17645 [Leptolyngbya sp. 15MV]
MATKKRRGQKSIAAVAPQDQLLALIDEALDTAKVARRHRKPLDGVNHYATKMANLRADATNLVSQIASKSVGETSAQAELMQRVFSVAASAKERAQAAQDLQFKIKTDWATIPPDNSRLEEGGVFPLVILSETERGYLVSVGRQANGCYAQGWYDGCAVMMRRLLESSIIEAFEAKKLDTKIKEPKSGDFVQLTALIGAALAETAWLPPVSALVSSSIALR